MIAAPNPLVPAVFGLAALAYAGLAIHVYRTTSSSESNTVSYFLFLLGTIIAGGAFGYAADDPKLYSAGFVLRFFSDGFLPVVLFLVYREYTTGRPPAALLAALCVVPVTTTVLAISNPMHELLWTFAELEAGTRFPTMTDSSWFLRVHGPFTYLLIAYTVLALAARLPTIARAHRRQVLWLMVCALLPYIPSIARHLVGPLQIDFPFTSLTLTLALPFYWWAAVRQRIFQFSPVAYQTILEHLRDPIMVVDNRHRIVGVNEAAQRLLGRRESQLVGEELTALLPEAKSVLQHNDSSDNLTQTIRMHTDRYFELSSAPLRGPSGQDQGAVVVGRDVTERIQTLRALADSEHLIRSLIENSSNGMLRFARDDDDPARKFRCVFANRAAEVFLDSGPGTLVGMPLEKLEPLEPRRLLERFSGREEAGGCVSYEVAVENSAEEVWLRIVGEPVGRDFSVTLIDITQRKHNEAKILEDALRDPLTGVLNRRGFESEAAGTIADCECGAVLYLDLNHFKAINDRFGHQAGDALLKAFGHRLEFCLRPEDILARLGGDEFAIVLPNVSVEDAKHVAERLVETASEAYIIQGQEIECAASVGIALIPTHGNDLWTLVSIADQAMYNTKSISQAEADNDRAAYVEASIAS